MMHHGHIHVNAMRQARLILTASSLRSPWRNTTKRGRGHLELLERIQVVRLCLCMERAAGGASAAGKLPERSSGTGYARAFEADSA